MNSEADLTRDTSSIEDISDFPNGASKSAETNNLEKESIENSSLETTETPTLDRDQTKLVIHAILFISDKPVTAQRIADILGDIEIEVVKNIVDELKSEINNNPNLPYILREIAGGYQFFTKPEFSPFIQKFLQVKKMRRFTPALLETLAIIAYKQPVTRAEVEAIRGVSVAHAFEQLLERNLIRVCGVSELPGKPKLYRTTEEFLTMFGFNSLQDLPGIDELRQET